jgi:hypothetical protein
MRTVYKYSIPVIDKFELDLPAHTSILYIGQQKNNPVMWCLVDTENKLIKRYFRLAGTGHDIPYPDPLDYIGTVILYNDNLVFHLFEVSKGG